MSDAPLDKAMTLPTRLRAARETAGLSQGQVAKLMNMHRPTVSEMEAGNRRITADELAKLADLYDTKLSWLLGDAPERAATDDPKLQLAARELSKLKPDDLDRLLKLIAAMKSDDDEKGA
ncbi:MAG: helix-turn-helix transcriptional regulator [Alphaproteobacteria bacterium]|nr:helix-turn-helix transcriptional regulator [Alphaproteobacteria bacterium]MBU0792636.1 helix-turn-helix transcriptional regulator [Alphaproteobacteria bacterium]MBU0875783.1 helix-turn-helix transcriptional regulator [Alphaproteobacteria bacterium]MBU1769026.1 helix-turn-helix transcriptional regulator [Alphaproteobacteria bacterium]